MNIYTFPLIPSVPHHATIPPSFFSVAHHMDSIAPVSETLQAGSREDQVMKHHLIIFLKAVATNTQASIQYPSSFITLLQTKCSVRSTQHRKFRPITGPTASLVARLCKRITSAIQPTTTAMYAANNNLPIMLSSLVLTSRTAVTSAIVRTKRMNSSIPP